jgi:uncharacterized membrane protein YeiH
MTLTPVIEHAGIAFGAMSGVLSTRGRHIDLFGALVLSIVAAFGGGSLRDVLIGQTPVAWLLRPEWLLNAMLSALLTFFICGRRVPPALLLEVVDAFMLAFFTIAGVEKILAAGIPVLGALVLGTMAGVAGGILRDVLLNQVPLVFQRQTYLYATAAFAGAVSYWALQHWVTKEIALAAAILLILLLRLMALKWKLSLPEFPLVDG